MKDRFQPTKRRRYDAAFRAEALRRRGSTPSGREPLDPGGRPR